MGSPRRTRAVSACSAIVLLGAWIAAARVAFAHPPQVGVGFTAGPAGVGRGADLWKTTVFHVGARGDILFGRDGGHSFGVGPYAELMIHDFGEIQGGAGGSVLFPIHELFPIVVSGGAYYRIPWQKSALDVANYGPEPGLAASLFWGTRSFNFHGPYEITVGILGQARIGLGPSEERSFVIALQADAAALWVPIVFFKNVVQDSPEAQRIK